MSRAGHDVRRLGIFGACTLVLAMRGHDRLLHPHLWAEDGARFLHDGYAHGLASLLEPYNGSLHVVPRLLAAMAAALPLAVAPAFLQWTATLVLAWVLSWPAADRAGDAVHDPWSRALLPLALCAAPGLAEVQGSVANLHAVWTLAIVWFATRRATDRPSRGDVVALGLLAFSAAESLVALPILLRRARRAAFDRPTAVVALAATAAHAWTWWTSSRVPAGHLHLADLLRAVDAGAVSGPLLGARLHAQLSSAHASGLAALAVVAGGLLITECWRRRGDPGLAGSMHAAVALTVATALAAAGRETGTWALASAGSIPWLSNRLAFVLWPAGVLLWAAWLDRHAPRLVRAFAVVSLAAWFTTPGVRRWHAEDWSQSLAAARATCAHPPTREWVEIPIAPDPWTAEVPTDRVCGH